MENKERQAESPQNAPLNQMGEGASFEDQLNDEVTKRLAMMEQPGYAFPERMRKSDFVIAGILMAVCLVITEFATLTAGVM